jgi:hypothetical protein
VTFARPQAPPLRARFGFEARKAAAEDVIPLRALADRRDGRNWEL